MKRKFAVFDIDGTLFRFHTYWEVALQLARRDQLHPKLNKEILELFDKWKRREHNKAFEDFDYGSVTIMNEIIHELDPKFYDKEAEKIVKPLLDHTYIYTLDLMKKLKKDGYMILAISGGREEEAKIFAKHHGIDDWIAQIWHKTPDGKKYTGKRRETYKNKDKLLQKLIDKHDLTLVGSFGVGDTGGDIAMMELTENPIAFNPNHKLLDHAQEKGWRIVIERKSIAYELKEEDGKYLLAKAE